MSAKDGLAYKFASASKPDWVVTAASKLENELGCMASIVFPILLIPRVNQWSKAKLIFL